MSVLLETSKGDIVVDLLVDDCPLACKNFLKLCKVKYYNNCIFHNVQRNFIMQTGDPTATGKGGTSIYGLLYGEQARFFEDEIRPHLKHKRKGVVGMASAGENLNASQFYITAADDVDSLDTKHTVFGQVAEGLDVLDKINEVFCDEAGRPLQNIRIRHTIVLDDPFEDPAQLEEHIPEGSPEPQFEQGGRLEDDWAPDQDQRPVEEVEQESRRSEAHNRAVVLEMIGDLPEAEAAPPSNMLFVCKLNQVTTEEDLEIIFSRFGKTTSCDVIRDWKTGDSLCYAFIGFDNDASCEEAYFKMNNVLIDDRRIKVDFSQSVHHLWKQFKKGGRKGGNAASAAEAAGHERDTGVAQERLGGVSGRLQLKERHGHGPTGGQRNDLLLGDDEPAEQQAPPRAQAARRQAPDVGRQPSSRRPEPERDEHRDRKRIREDDRAHGHRDGRSEQHPGPPAAKSSKEYIRPARDDDKDRLRDSRDRGRDPADFRDGKERIGRSHASRDDYERRGGPPDREADADRRRDREGDRRQDSRERGRDDRRGRDDKGGDRKEKDGKSSHSTHRGERDHSKERRHQRR